QNYTLSYATRAATNCFDYPNFNSTNGLQLTGNASVAAGALRLTPSARGQTGTAYAIDKQQCAAGFDTTFRFQITSPTSDPGVPPGAEGIMFSIQNVGPNDPTTGFGATANYVSVVFNTFLNSPGCPNFAVCDVSDNSVGVLLNQTFIAQTDLNPL